MDMGTALRELGVTDEMLLEEDKARLDAFTEDNGATRVVPGSHRLGLRPAHVMDRTEDEHPDEIMLLGEAGTVFILNSHLWHSGTTNTTARPRRALHSYFCRRGLKQ